MVSGDKGIEQRIMAFERKCYRKSFYQRIIM